MRVRDEEQPIRLGGAEPLRPCSARTQGTLGFAQPTVIPCSLKAGHDGRHRYTIEWSD
jgi:hypothetical protein